MTTQKISKPQLESFFSQGLPETPFYFYDENILRSLSASFQTAISSDPDIHLHYAMKANSSEAVLKVLKEYGAGLDIVSGEEMKLGLKAGFRPDQIVYSGVGKSEKELISAIENDRVQLGGERAKVLARALRCHPAVLVFPGWNVEHESAA